MRRQWYMMEGLNFDIPVIRMQKSLADLDRAVDQLVLVIDVAKEAAAGMGPAGVGLLSLVDRKRERGKMLLKRLRMDLQSRIKELS